jgi:hypothetical protein
LRVDVQLRPGVAKVPTVREAGGDLHHSLDRRASGRGAAQRRLHRALADGVVIRPPDHLATLERRVVGEVRGVGPTHPGEDRYVLWDEPLFMCLVGFALALGEDYTVCTCQALEPVERALLLRRTRLPSEPAVDGVAAISPRPEALFARLDLAEPIDVKQRVAEFVPVMMSPLKVLALVRLRRRRLTRVDGHWHYGPGFGSFRFIVPVRLSLSIVGAGST